MVKKDEVNKFYLFTLMIAKSCSYDKHFMVAADSKVYKHYFKKLNNFIILFSY